MHRTPIHLLAVVALVCAAAGSGQAGSIVAHWTFDGNGLDSSGNHNDATAHGNIAYTPGMYGQAAQFHGAGDYFQVPNNPGMQLRGTKEFSVAAYVNATTLGQQNILIHGLGCSTWGSWFLGVQGGEPDTTVYADSFVFGVRNGNGSGYIGATAKATAGEWVHLAATFDGAMLKLYANGEEAGSIAASLPYDSGETLYMGGDPGCSGRSWYTGQLDDVYICSRALTPEQVREVAGGVAPKWVKASNPIPANGMVGANTPLLQWTPGETAALHNVYLGTSPNLTAADQQASRSIMAFMFYAPGFQPGATYYWRVDEIDKDGVTVYPGEVWSFVAQASTAYYPSPRDGVNTAWPTPMLTWMPGVAAIGHHVYFGDNLEAVTQAAATTDKGALAVTETSFAPGTLDNLTTYYWKVDEVQVGNTVKAGPVWKFTTCLPVDSFDTYTDKTGECIFDTWIDGITNNNGAMVGYANAPFAESKIVHSGTQSMPFDYNNVVAPFYSEAVREFDSAQDWTTGGADTLVLYVRGATSNSRAPLYVALEDASKHFAAVVHPDAAVVNTREWAEWKIPLSSFAGVNAAKIKKLYLGVGDRANPVKGGTGLLFIDDICLTKP